MFRCSSTTGILQSLVRYQQTSTARRWLVTKTARMDPYRLHPSAVAPRRLSLPALRPAVVGSSTTTTTTRAVSKNNAVPFRRNHFRAFSSTTEGNKKQQPADEGAGDDTTKEIVLTPGEKVVVASRLTMWAGIFAFASVCAYYIVRELIPTKMSPNRVFDRSLEVLRKDPGVLRRYGDTIKGYGRDHGGHREGRRNFIEHTEYVDPDDGSNRTRVRYNIEGPYGNAFVFAEVSANQPSGEFVYILVQDKNNGRTHTVVDNRAAMTAARLAGSNKEASSAMSQLLRGGSGGGGNQK